MNHIRRATEVIIDLDTELYIRPLSEFPDNYRAAVEQACNNLSLGEFIKSSTLTTLLEPETFSRLSILIFSNPQLSVAVRDLTSLFLSRFYTNEKDYAEFIHQLSVSGTFHHEFDPDNNAWPDQYRDLMLSQDEIANTLQANKWLVPLLVMTLVRF